MAKIKLMKNKNETIKIRFLFYILVFVNAVKKEMKIFSNISTKCLTYEIIFKNTINEGDNNNSAECEHMQTEHCKAKYCLCEFHTNFVSIKNLLFIFSPGTRA